MIVDDDEVAELMLARSGVTIRPRPCGKKLRQRYVDHARGPDGVYAAVYEDEHCRDGDRCDHCRPLGEDLATLVDSGEWGRSGPWYSLLVYNLTIAALLGAAHWVGYCDAVREFRDG